MAESLGSQFDKSGLADVRDGLRSNAIQADAIAATQEEVRDESLANMRRITGDGRLRNWPKPGRADKATVKLRTTGASGTIAFEPAGLWGLVTEGARPHRIAGRSGNRLVVPVGGGRWRSGPFRHPGMRPLGNPAGAPTGKIGDTLADELGAESTRRFQ